MEKPCPSAYDGKEDDLQRCLPAARKGSVQYEILPQMLAAMALVASVPPEYAGKHEPVVLQLSIPSNFSSLN